MVHSIRINTLIIPLRLRSKHIIFTRCKHDIFIIFFLLQIISIISGGIIVNFWILKIFYFFLQIFVVIIIIVFFIKFIKSTTSCKFFICFSTIKCLTHVKCIRIGLFFLLLLLIICCFFRYRYYIFINIECIWVFLSIRWVNISV